MKKKPFKKVLDEYNALKKRIGLSDVKEASDLIEKRDKKGLLEYTKQIKDKTLREAVLRLAKYL
jgi:hypothetical protein